MKQRLKTNSNKGLYRALIVALLLLVPVPVVLGWVPEVDVPEVLPVRFRGAYSEGTLITMLSRSSDRSVSISIMRYSEAWVTDRRKSY